MWTNLQVGSLLIDTKSNHSHHSASNEYPHICIHPRPEFGKRDAGPRLDNNVAHICRFSPHMHRESAEIASSNAPGTPTHPRADHRKLLYQLGINNFILHSTLPLLPARKLPFVGLYQCRAPRNRFSFKIRAWPTMR